MCAKGAYPFDRTQRLLGVNYCVRRTVTRIRGKPTGRAESVWADSCPYTAFLGVIVYLKLDVRVRQTRAISQHISPLLGFFLEHAFVPSCVSFGQQKCPS